MARNEEKQLGRLNRLWLQQLNEDQAKKDPPRPGLGSLHTAAEVKKWLPSIKRDIDFCLKQSQVTCYPERQIEEFTLQIDQLTKEYKAYVRKLRELEPGLTAVPWTDRAYNRKRKLQEEQEGTESNKAVCEDDGKESHATASSAPKDEIMNECHFLLSTPLLEKDEDFSSMYGQEEPAQIVYNSDPDRENAPLQFKFKKLSGHKCDQDNSVSNVNNISLCNLSTAVTSDLETELCKNSCVDRMSKDYLHITTSGNSVTYENCCSTLSGTENRDTLNQSIDANLCNQVVDTEQRTLISGKRDLDNRPGTDLYTRTRPCDSCIMKSYTVRTSNENVDENIPTMISVSDSSDINEGLSKTVIPQRKDISNKRTISTSIGKVLTLNLPYSDSSDEES